MLLRVLTRTLSSLFRFDGFRKPGWVSAEAWMGKIRFKAYSHTAYSQHQARAEGAEGAWAPAPLPKVPFCQGNFFFFFFFIKHPSVKACPI